MSNTVNLTSRLKGALALGVIAATLLSGCASKKPQKIVIMPPPPPLSLPQEVLEAQNRLMACLDKKAFGLDDERRSTYEVGRLVALNCPKEVHQYANEFASRATSRASAMYLFQDAFLKADSMGAYAVQMKRSREFADASN